MSNAIFHVPVPKNEPVLGYAPGSPERSEIQKALKEAKSKVIDIPMYINGKKVRTKSKVDIYPPHELSHQIGRYSNGNKSHVQAAIKAALGAKADWETMPWEHRAGIFLKAADLITGKYRAQMNAATMLGQSKSIHQAEIDCVCELADFLRFNVRYMEEIYGQQPQSSPGLWNRLEYRPLEGFVFAITPFNFTAIAGNLCAAPAMLGNVVVWKPSDTQIYSARLIMEIFEEAGLPPGVINLIYGDGPMIGDVVFNHADFAGLHFTGSTGVFQHLWSTIGANIKKYKSYPRIVGETGGKDFIIAHESANPKEVATAISRGSFEFQGQKCSAASRVYIPQSMWSSVEKTLTKQIESMKMGPTDDLSNYINAVIDERSFDKIRRYINAAKRDRKAKVIIGGNCNKRKGYFIEPTVILTTDPKYKTMCEEIFGPVVTIYVYKNKDFDKMLDILDDTSPYALTGAVFAKDRDVVVKMTERLRHSAGNFYINDKPTGAVVGQQPFGGGRASGTNDKAGSILNLYRWLSPRTIKENLNPPTDYTYPFLG